MLAIAMESEGEAPTVEFHPFPTPGACIGFVTTLSPVYYLPERGRKGQVDAYVLVGLAMGWGMVISRLHKALTKSGRHTGKARNSRRITQVERFMSLPSRKH